MDPIRFDAPGEYVISVQGIVNQSLQEMINDANITFKNDGQMPLSEIHLTVKDQAHLIGIMNILYDCHLVILNVTKTNPKKNHEQVET